MDKRTFIGTILGLVILIIGTIGLYILEFPAGVLTILPCVIIPISNIIRWYRKKKQE